MKKQKSDPTIKAILREYNHDVKKHMVEQRQEFERYVGVVAEDFKGQVEIIAEQYGGIEQHLVGIRDMVAKNTEDIEIIKIDVHGLKEDMGIVKTDIEFMKGGLKRKVDYDEFQALEKRMVAVESKIRK